MPFDQVFKCGKFWHFDYQCSSKGRHTVIVPIANVDELRAETLVELDNQIFKHEPKIEILIELSPL